MSNVVSFKKHPPSNDPVYAAIERYERLNAIHNEVSSRQDRSDKWKSEDEEATAAWCEAIDDMWQTVPTTRAGAVALIKKLFEVWGEDLADDEDTDLVIAPEDAVPLLRTLARALPHIV